MQGPRFSVIIPSFLGPYKGAATDRERKLIRAIESVLHQTYTDYEIIVIADGCEATFNLISEMYAEDHRVNCYLIRKQPQWSGAARNFAIGKAAGQIITYLDADDKWGKSHLRIINDNFGTYDWVWFNDMVMDASGKANERKCIINQKYHNGTSNFAHKRTCKITWGSGYGYDDYQAIQSLLNHYPNHSRIPTPEYHVCHVPYYSLDV